MYFTKNRLAPGMVFVVDEGSDFHAPLPKVWKLLQDEGNHRHKQMENVKGEMEGEGRMLLSFESPLPDGRRVSSKIRLTLVPPLGSVMEWIEGPLAGSKAMEFYEPKGNATGVTVVGDYTSKVLPEDQIAKFILHNLEEAYNEDEANLRKV
jgi:hypothetical protein